MGLNDELLKQEHPSFNKLRILADSIYNYTYPGFHGDAKRPMEEYAKQSVESI